MLTISQSAILIDTDTLMSKMPIALFYISEICSNDSRTYRSVVFIRGEQGINELLGHFYYLNFFHFVRVCLVSPQRYCLGI